MSAWNFGHNEPNGFLPPHVATDLAIGAPLETVAGKSYAGAVYVIHGDRARRTRVRLGLSGFDACEVLDGLAEGDEVVLSDMTDYAHLSEIRIR